MRNFILITLLHIFLPVHHSGAQEKILQFISGQKINVGTLSEDDSPSTYRFVFQNSGKQVVKLAKVSTTCGCTAARFTLKELNPGEEGEVVLTYNPDGHPGKLYTRAFVYTDQSSTVPVAELVLTGMVTPSKDRWRNFPYKMGNLRLRRKVIRFTEAGPKGIAVERLTCVNSGDKPLTVTAIKTLLPEYVTVSMQPEIIPAGAEADIYIKVDKRLIPEGQKFPLRLPVILEGVSSTPSERTITVSIEAGF